MDRLGNIEAFVEAAELGSFTHAARRLRITPSALSRRVAQLEDELGVRLFHRTTRAIRLSAEGRLFFERARGALRELAAAEDAMSGLRDRPSGLLRVEAPTVFGRHVLVPALSRFLSRHAEVQLELILRDHPGDLVADGIDLAVCLGPLDDSGLIGRRIGRTRMRVCGAPGYLRRMGTPRTIDALARHERLGFFCQGAVAPWRLRDGAQIREVPPGRRIVVNDSEALIDLATGGVGLAWLCDFMVERARGAGELVEVLADAACEETPIHVLSQHSRHVLPKVRAFTDFLVAELARAGLAA